MTHQEVLHTLLKECACAVVLIAWAWYEMRLPKDEKLPHWQDKRLKSPKNPELN